MTEDRLSELLQPFLPRGVAPPPSLLAGLKMYLELLVRWNARTNLTSIRDPESIVTRHFGESLFAATRLPDEGSLLDLGSGAGFPGIPMQMLRPDLSVTLAESQGKKAAFLREAVRTLTLPTTVWPRRAEELPSGSTFDIVALRAVDTMPFALAQAAALARDAIFILGSTTGTGALDDQFIPQAELLPLSANRYLVVATRTRQ